jgi:hypothetical protein
MSFDLSSYEDVNARIKRFRTEFPSGRLIAVIEKEDLNAGWLLIRAEAYREYEDEKPSAVDYAYGNVANLPHNMKKWLVEDTTTSAYGRVIGLLSPSDNARPTRQDMEKVERLQAQPAVEVDLWATATPAVKVDGVGSVRPAAETIADIKAQLGGEILDAAPICSHGRMVYKEGVSPKTGSKYRGYTCSSKSRGDQCKPVWL